MIEEYEAGGCRPCRLDISLVHQILSVLRIASFMTFRIYAKSSLVLFHWLNFVYARDNAKPKSDCLALFRALAMALAVLPTLTAAVLPQQIHINSPHQTHLFSPLLASFFNLRISTQKHHISNARAPHLSSCVKS